MALLVADVPFALREVALRAKPAALIAASPKATVPVLVPADGPVIDQSLAIMRWALARHDPERWLDADDADLIALFDDRFKHHLDRYKYPARAGGDGTGDRAAGVALLEMLEARLADRDSLCRATRGLTDIAVMPFVRQFAGVDPGWFDALPLPGVKGWLARHVSSPLFDRAMVRVSPWRPDDSPFLMGRQAA